MEEPEEHKLAFLKLGFHDYKVSAHKGFVFLRDISDETYYEHMNEIVENDLRGHDLDLAILTRLFGFELDRLTFGANKHDFMNDLVLEIDRITGVFENRDMVYSGLVNGYSKQLNALYESY